MKACKEFKRNRPEAFFESCQVVDPKASLTVLASGGFRVTANVPQSFVDNHNMISMEEKYNQVNYYFYVIVNGKIESGWSYWEDAREQIGELPDPSKGNLVRKKNLHLMNLDADKNSDWANA